MGGSAINYKVSKTSQLSLPKEMKKFYTAIQRAVVYMEANDRGMVRCISCGMWIPISQADGGHGEGKGRNIKLARYRWNIHAQCHRCNRLKDGNTGAWYEGVRAFFGEEMYQYLKDMVRASKGDFEALQRILPEDRQLYIEKKWSAADYREERLKWERIIRDNKYKEEI